MKFLHFLLLCFVFVVATSLAVDAKARGIPFPRVPELQASKSFVPLPVLSGSATFPIVSAQAALAVDLGSGVPLYEKNPDSPLLPASTTKIVTALVALERFSPDQILTVGKVTVDGQKIGFLAGQKFLARDLVSALLIASANDAAEVLAANFPGGRDAFVDAMNLKAKELSLANSHFTNPAGLDGVGQVTTARDLVRVAEYAMRNPAFRETVRQKERAIESVDGKSIYKLTNTNKLLGELEGVFGVKTGWTENARENLVTYIERGDRKVMLVVLGSQDRFGETKEIVEWIFANYEWKPVTYSP